MRKLLAQVGLATPAVAGLALGLSLVTPAQAAHHTPQWHYQHYVQCFNLMLTNPAQQSKLCGPFHYVEPPDNNHAPVGLPLPVPPVTTTTTSDEKPCDPPPCMPPPCWPPVYKGPSEKSESTFKAPPAPSFKEFPTPPAPSFKTSSAPSFKAPSGPPSGFGGFKPFGH